MKKLIFNYLFLFVLLGVVHVNAQEVERFPLWPQGAAEDNGLGHMEKKDKSGRIVSSHEAELWVYHPPKEKQTGMSVVVCPGGGYAHLAMAHEGEMFAEWLIRRGITAVILKYRMPNHHHRIPLADASRAVRLVRSRADEWGIHPQQVGIAGFSAGGHLASTLATHYEAGKPQATDRLERYSSRPDFVLLFYPVISMTNTLAHRGSREALLGKNPGEELILKYSNEKQVNEHVPPVFIALSDDDRTVSPLNGVAFYQALKEYKVPAVLYIFPSGGHGWGLRNTFEYYPQWTVLLEKWLKKWEKDNAELKG